MKNKFNKAQWRKIIKSEVPQLLYQNRHFLLIDQLWKQNPDEGVIVDLADLPFLKLLDGLMLFGLCHRISVPRWNVLLLLLGWAFQIRLDTAKHWTVFQNFQFGFFKDLFDILVVDLIESDALFRDQPGVDFSLQLEVGPVDVEVAVEGIENSLIVDLLILVDLPGCQNFLTRQGLTCWWYSFRKCSGRMRLVSWGTSPENWRWQSLSRADLPKGMLRLSTMGLM